MAGLYNNQGIAANTVMLTTVSSYEAQPWLAPLLTCIRVGGQANIPSGNTFVARFSNATLANLNSIGSNTCAALADAVPASVSGIAVTANVPGLTGAVRTGASQVIPSDLTKFMQAFSAAQGYVTVTNRVINESRNSATFLGPTFTDMNALTTGGLSDVSVNLPAFARDLAALGQAMNLAQLGNLGSPAQLLANIVQAGGLLPGIQAALEAQAVTQDEILGVTQDITQSDAVQQRMYRAMTAIQGDDLAQTLSLLDVTTTGLTSLADLLNPLKMFPSSYASLRVRTSQGLLPVYAGQSVNAQLQTALPEYVIKVAV